MRAQPLGQVAEDLLREPEVEIVPAETGIAVGRKHLEDPTAQPEDRDVERAAAEVVDRDDALVASIEPICERCRGGLVHEAEHVEAGELPGGARRLPLAVVEVCRDGHDGSLDRLAERRFRPALELAKDIRGDLRGCTLAAAGDDPHDASTVLRIREAISTPVLVRHVLVSEPHEALDGQHGVEGQLGRQLLGGAPDDDFTPGDERDRRRQQHLPRLGVRERARHAVLEDGDQTVRRAEIDADDARHHTPNASSTSSTRVPR